MVQLEGGHKQLEGGLERLDGAMERLGSALVQLRTDVMERIDRLQDTVTGMRDDIGVNFARADRAVDAAADNARQIELLGREVSAMERQIQRLQTDVRTLKGEP